MRAVHHAPSLPAADVALLALELELLALLQAAAEAAEGAELGGAAVGSEVAGALVSAAKMELKGGLEATDRNIML